MIIDIILSISIVSVNLSIVNLNIKKGMTENKEEIYEIDDQVMD